MNKKKLLYLNLSTNEKDISLGFSNSWLSKFADEFETVDLISLNKSSNNRTEFKNVNIFKFMCNNFSKCKEWRY